MLIKYCILSQSIFSNFASDAKFTTKAYPRLCNIFENMFSESTAENFLANASCMMLELTSKSADFNKDLFEKPLKDCVFTVGRFHIIVRL